MLQPERLGTRLKELLADRRTDRLVSAASIWELGLKQRRERVVLPDDISGQLQAIGADVLDVTMDHAIASTKLPFHHADPFDRMLVAQARIEGLTLVTADRRMAAYDVDLLTP